MRAPRIFLATALFLVTEAAEAQAPKPSEPAPSASQQPAPPAPPLTRAPGSTWQQPMPLPPAYAASAPRYRDNGMRIAGIVLTSVASAMLIAGLTVMALDLSGGPLSDPDFNVLTVWVGAPLMLGSTVVAGVGVPLWVVGARPPASAPSLMLHPGRLSLRF
ncbi:Hypothetical protein A7982_03817 [Minicystis rosea]|nr:Hypothetical protein A7982_03817 [Minicystis rosea]